MAGTGDRPPYPFKTWADAARAGHGISRETGSQAQRGPLRDDETYGMAYLYELDGSLFTDRQDINAMRDDYPNVPADATGIVVTYKYDDPVAVWATTWSRPYSNETIYRLVWESRHGGRSLRRGQRRVPSRRAYRGTQQGWRVYYDPEWDKYVVMQDTAETSGARIAVSAVLPNEAAAQSMARYKNDTIGQGRRYRTPAGPTFGAYWVMHDADGFFIVEENGKPVNAVGGPFSTRGAARQFIREQGQTGVSYRGARGGPRV